MAYVILGHQFLSYLRVIKNVNEIETILKQPFWFFVVAAYLSVDVFFWISGFFTGFILLKPESINKLNSIKSFLQAIFHRWFRIIPSYLYTMFFYAGVFKFFGDGPIWFCIDDFTRYKINWWRGFLLIDNFSDNIFLSWSWYLSVDFQLFIFSLLIIFLYKKSRIIAKFVLFFSMSFSLICSYALCVKYQFFLYPFASQDKWDKKFDSVMYTKPWIRAPVYLLGLYLGMIYNEFQRGELPKLFKLYEEITRKTLMRIPNYLLGIVLIVFIVVLPKTLQIDSNSWKPYIHYLYITFHRIIFVIGLNLIIFPNLLGKKTIFSEFLSMKPLILAGKLSFCVYLIHMMVIQKEVFTLKNGIDYNVNHMLANTFLTILGSLIFGLVLNLFVEKPFRKLMN